MDLVPIKIRIGLKEDGSAKYPTFNDLIVVQQSGMDWSRYVDTKGSGWLYDCCGHRDEEPGSPRGQQWGVLLVPDAFATEAESRFPGDVTRMTETECQTFYDTKHAREFEDEEIDAQVLQKIKTKKDLGLVLTEQQKSAIDPTINERGIRRNWRKTWVSYKAKMGVTVLP